MLKNDQRNLHLGNPDKLKFKKLYNVSRETINKLELDLDSFELQSFLDPNNESYIL